MVQLWCDFYSILYLFDLTSRFLTWSLHGKSEWGFRKSELRLRRSESVPLPSNRYRIEIAPQLHHWIYWGLVHLSNKLCITRIMNIFEILPFRTQISKTPALWTPNRPCRSIWWRLSLMWTISILWAFLCAVRELEIETSASMWPQFFLVCVARINAPPSLINTPAGRSRYETLCDRFGMMYIRDTVLSLLIVPYYLELTTVSLINTLLEQTGWNNKRLRLLLEKALKMRAFIWIEVSCDSPLWLFLEIELW